MRGARRPGWVALALLASGFAAAVRAAERPAVHVWLEPEWFSGIQGHFGYWTGTAKPTGRWAIAGPGISAEWSQGGESGWNSIGVPAEEKQAACERTLDVPRGGKYRLWVRYVDHRGKTEPFSVRVEQGGKAALSGELGAKPVVPPNDEYMLYWGFSFGWAALEGTLQEGPATLRLVVDKAGEGWRQVDALLLTDDLSFTPAGREKPELAYQAAMTVRPAASLSFRGSGKGFSGGAALVGKPPAGRTFSMWTQVDPDPKWWGAQKQETLGLYDILFQFSPPVDIREKFHQQFAGRRDLPILSWKGLLPGVYLGAAPDLSPASPVRQWLERTKTPFYILTNYASPAYKDGTGPATYQALAGPLAGQFLGYIHGEAVGTTGVNLPPQPLAPDRRGHVDALGPHFRKQQAEHWSAIYKTPVPETHRSKSIPCLSINSTGLSHLFYESGSTTVGYEIDATMAHAPMRIAFLRGAARQYGGSWIHYASGNFGDACNYFYQQPVVPRGAPGWFHSKYSITDGVNISWYRRLYYLNYLSGASSIYWEQNLYNQWILPGPGTHPIQLSPFGRATEEFQQFVDRLPDRGEPYAPVALLLSHGHSFEPVTYHGKMLDVFPENASDRELRALFNVLWHPTEELQGQPINPDRQSMPSGVYGNLFDVLVDRPNRAKAILEYPVVWAAGDVKLDGAMLPVLEEYLKRGGTLVVNVEAARGKLPERLLGVRLTGKQVPSDSWTPEGGTAQPATPYSVERAELAGAKPLAWAAQGVPLITRHPVGTGAVLLTLAPRMMGRDEHAHPALSYLMNGLTEGLLPVEVRLADGKRPSGEVFYQLNRTKSGWVVLLMNTQGIDKTQSGIARVDRRKVVDVVLRTALPVRSAREFTQPRDLAPEKSGAVTQLRLRVHPGDVQVVSLITE